MAVDFDKFTHRSQQATLRAQELAKAHNHQYVEPAHLLLGLLDQADGIVYPLLSKLDIAVPTLRAANRRATRANPQGVWG